MYSMVLMMAMTSAPEAMTCHKSHSCYGCTGYASCYGCSGYSCSGYSCSGCYGCTGCTGYYYGCTGCKGYYGCSGCTGYGAGCAGYSTGCYGYYSGAPASNQMYAGVAATSDPVAKNAKAANEASALITVNVPADAKVTIDGSATTSTSAVRVFSTPDLQPGTINYYTFSATIVRNGKTLTASEKIAVEAGGNVKLTLNPTNAPKTIASK